MHDTVIIGVGREDFGDDAVGPMVVANLAKRPLPADLHLARSDPNDLAQLLTNRRRALIVDACLSNRPPGRLFSYD